MYELPCDYLRTPTDKRKLKQREMYVASLKRQGLSVKGEIGESLFRMIGYDPPVVFWRLNVFSDVTEWSLFHPDSIIAMQYADGHIAINKE